MMPASMPLGDAEFGSSLRQPEGDLFGDGLSGLQLDEAELASLVALQEPPDAVLVLGEVEGRVRKSGAEEVLLEERRTGRDAREVRSGSDQGGRQGHRRLAGRRP